MKDNKIKITIDSGQVVEAQAPMIVSASRATDIPAFYADWFFERLRKGYVIWKNPYSGVPSYVSFRNTRFIVFWSKNPRPLIPYLSILKEMGIGCYVQYTLNDYSAEKLEPNLPPLSERIETFKRLTDEMGVGTVVLRFDPLILTERITIDNLIEKVAGIADKLKGYAEKLLFSFADMAEYRKVSRNLAAAGINYKEWREEDMIEFASRLAAINDGSWNYQLATCAEKIDLSEYGIEHNRCIDPELIARIAQDDIELQNYLFSAKRDKGQRKLCGCITSKDIGQYNTCPHGCLYCYANTSPQSALNNFNTHKSNPHNESIF